jgi:hypothetical protein
MLVSALVQADFEVVSLRYVDSFGLDSLLPLPFACSKNLVCSSTRPVPWGFTTEEFSQLAGSVTAYLEASLVKTYIVF